MVTTTSNTPCSPVGSIPRSATTRPAGHGNATAKPGGKPVCSQPPPPEPARVGCGRSGTAPDRPRRLPLPRSAGSRLAVVTSRSMDTDSDFDLDEIAGWLRDGQQIVVLT